MPRCFIGLGLLLSALSALAPDARAEGKSVAAASRADLGAATREFDIANKAFDKGKFDVALEHFRASYAKVQSPNSILMIARCERELGHVRDAYASYGEALAAAQQAAKGDPKYKQAISDADDDLASYKKEIALLRVTISGAEDPEAHVGDLTLGSADLANPIALAPGSYTLSVRTKSGVSKDVPLTLSAGEERSITVDLSPPTPQPRPALSPTPVERPRPRAALRTAAYVSGGIGVAGGVVFGVFGAMSKSKFNHLKQTCPSGICAPSEQNDIDAGKRDQTIANVGLVVGAVGLAAGVTLFVLGGHDEQPSTAIAIAPDRLSVRGCF